MTRFNLNLLASLCENNNSANNGIGGQTPKSALSALSTLNNNNNDSLTPNHNLIGQPSAAMTGAFLKGSPSSSSIVTIPHTNSGLQSSALDAASSAMLDQMPDFSFADNLLNSKSGAINPANSSFSRSKTPSDRALNDSSAATPSECIGRASSLASPTASDRPSSGLAPPPANHGQASSKSGKTTMAIRCKFGHLGSNKGQFSSPHGFCLGAEEEIVIADTYNHRICIFDKEGEFLYQFGSAGKEDSQLWHPRKVSLALCLNY